MQENLQETFCDNACCESPKTCKCTSKSLKPMKELNFIESVTSLWYLN